MASVLIKNLPDELHQRLKQRARRHHRGLNKERPDRGCRPGRQRRTAAAALAASLSVPLVTEDRKLQRVLRNRAISMTGFTASVRGGKPANERR